MPERKTDILEMGLDRLEEHLCRLGESPYRARQVLHWIFHRFAVSFSLMTDLDRRLRQSLDRMFVIGNLTLERAFRSSDGCTEKAVFRLRDEQVVESVSMRDGSRYTFCISSQVGCRMGCRFCATGAMGFRRNLTTGEMLGQVLGLARRVGRPGNIVFMGMGEPLDNLTAVSEALVALSDPARLGIGAKSITISTAGMITGIRALTHGQVRPYLALSLNSPFDRERSILMPINRRYPLAEVLAACDEYRRVTRRRITIEYIMLAGVNMSAQHAVELAAIARRLRALVNLIVYNPVPGTQFRSPNAAELTMFRNKLKCEGAQFTQRYRRGRDIKAGCGQLGSGFLAAGSG